MLCCESDRRLVFAFWDTSEKVIEQAGDAGIHKDMQRQLHVVRVVFLARLADLLGLCVLGHPRKGD